MSLVAPSADEAFVVATMHERYRRSVTLAIGVAVLCVGVGIGVIVGHFTSRNTTFRKSTASSTTTTTRLDDHDEISERLLNEISAERLRENLR